MDNDFQINQHSLDHELIQQPILVHHWSTKLAEAKLKLDAALNELSVARAKTDQEIRKNPEQFGLTKVTEATVDAAITTDTIVQKNITNVNDLRYEMRLCDAACTACEHKKRSLEKLVELHGRDYFSAPTPTKSECTPPNTGTSGWIYEHSVQTWRGCAAV